MAPRTQLGLSPLNSSRRRCGASTKKPRTMPGLFHV
jgi:hypothetical protein